MSKKPSIYNVHDYSDAELYTLLDLVNPSDRELEAKILMQIHKYESITTKSAQKLVLFFDDIYNHFFENEDEDGIEGFENTVEASVDVVDNTDNQPMITSSAPTNSTREVYTEDYKEPKLPPDQLKKTDISYTQSLEYSRGKLNPLLQQTTKRIISIDSQYRSDKRSMPTSFTFNLSEPLKDVVSLKLYSVQIPYTWYTIGKAYGNNFFYFKGRTAGIDSGSGLHDIKLEIEPGNYSPAELIAEVNSSIDTIKSGNIADISMGNTNIYYNKFNSKTSTTIELTKGYNESSYVLDFEGSFDIQDYLGFTDTQHSTRTIRSAIDVSYQTDVPFVVSNSNNYFTVNVYQDDFINIDSSFDVVITNGTYTRNTLVDHVKTVLSGTDKLTNTDCYIDASGRYIDMKLQLSRIPNSVNENTKMSVVFYDQDHYILDLDPIIFVGTPPLDISGNIGSDISGTIYLSIVSAVSLVEGQIMGTIYNNDAVIYNIVSTQTRTDMSNNDLLVYLRDIINLNQLFNADISDNSIIFTVNASDRIWTNSVGIESCFQFENITNNMNEIISDKEAKEQGGRYTIFTEPYISLTPNIETFRNSINDISFSIPNTLTVGSYSLNEYISAINTSIRKYDDSHNNILNSPAENYVFNNETAFPTGTYAYLQNNIVQMKFDVNKVFDESMYIIDLSGSIFDNNIVTMFAGASNNKLLDLSGVSYSTVATNGTLDVSNDTIIFTLIPKTGSGINGNEEEAGLVLRMDSRITPGLELSGNGRQINDIIMEFIKPVFDNYVDPISNVKIFEGTDLQSTAIGTSGFNIIFDQINIKKTLLAKNYRISFVDTADTWNSNLKIPDSLINDEYIDTSFNMTIPPNYIIYDTNNLRVDISEMHVDSSGNILDSSGNIYDSGGTLQSIIGDIDSSGSIIYKVDPSGNVIVSGKESLPIPQPLTISTSNGTFRLKAVDDGVATSTGENDIVIILPSNIYYRDTLIAAINSQINDSPSNTTIRGTSVSIVKKDTDNKYYTKFILDLNRQYTTRDYNLVFYDESSFVTCTAGSSSVQNTTWDTTIGWIMGFRDYTTYDLSVDPSTDIDNVVDRVNGNEITIIGDTGLSTNLYNYFLICLDDFNQSHLNDGLVTITNVDNRIPLPSYANRSNFVCDPVTGQKVYSVTNDANVTNRLTEKQIYATEVAANSAGQDNSIGSSVSTKSYGTGPFVTDVFGLIPMKVSGLQNGSTYVEFGGTLQNQERSYFGPVNITRMSVKLVTDRGNLVDLNRANWSFSLVCEQLNKLEPSSAK